MYSTGHPNAGFSPAKKRHALMEMCMRTVSGGECEDNSLPYDATTAPCTLIGSARHTYSIGDVSFPPCPGCACCNTQKCYSCKPAAGQCNSQMRITCIHFEVWSSRLSPKPRPLVERKSPGKDCPATVVVESGGAGGSLPVILLNDFASDALLANLDAALRIRTLLLCTGKTAISRRKQTSTSNGGRLHFSKLLWSNVFAVIDRRIP